MRLEQMHYLIEVAKTGSITLAADILHISQPNISHAITSLEKEIGVTIFSRTRAGTKTTEVGKQIIDYAQQIVTLVNEIQETANRHSTQIQEVLKIGAISGICTSFLPKTLSSFSSKHPKVDLEIIEGNSNILEEKLLAGDIDIALVGIPEESEYKHLTSHKYLECKILACVGKNSPLAHSTSVSYTQIVEHPIIATSGYMRKQLKKYGTPRELFYSSSSEASKHVIAESLATSFYMDISLQNDPYVSSGQVIPLTITENPILYLYWLHQKNNQSAACEAFIKELLLQVGNFNLWKSIMKKTI